MKTGVFIGSCDKSDFLLYLASFLKEADKKVLVIDATERQWLGFTVSKGWETKCTVVDYFGVDVAIGFSRYKDVLAAVDKSGYDLVLIDLDRPEFLKEAKLSDAIHFLVSTFEKDVVFRNLKLLQEMTSTDKPLSMPSFIFRALECSIDEDYITEIYNQLPIVLSPVHLIPFDEWDAQLKIENAFHMKVTVKRLTNSYVTAVQAAATLLFDLDRGLMKKSWKALQRRK